MLVLSYYFILFRDNCIYYLKSIVDRNMREILITSSGIGEFVAIAYYTCSLVGDMQC